MKAFIYSFTPTFRRLVTTLVLGAMAQATASAQSYTITPIGRFEDNIYRVSGINNSGVIVGGRTYTLGGGSGYVAPPFRFWSGQNRMEFLPCKSSQVVGGGVNQINDNAWCAGWCNPDATSCSWDPAGALTTFGASYASGANGLNDAATPTLVGNTYSRSTGRQPAYYKNGKWVNLPTLTGKGGIAYSIDNQDHIVGVDSGSGHAVLWVPGTKGYGTPMDLTATYGGFGGTSLTKTGQVYGGSQILDLATGAVTTLTGPSGEAATITSLSNRTSSGTQRAVGYYDTGTARIPFIWDGTTVADLATLLPLGSGWDLQQGSAPQVYINDLGWIVGMGLYTDPIQGPQNRAYLMKP